MKTLFIEPGSPRRMATARASKLRDELLNDEMFARPRCLSRDRDAPDRSTLPLDQIAAGA